MDNNKWKDYLLKSGLPLEFEVKKALDRLGFYTQHEFSYLRNNEDRISTEFSYDIDAEIIIDHHRFELLVECKYRDESTKWLFLPEEYNYSTRGIGTTSFRNTNDFFYPKKYLDLFKAFNVIRISPLCSKGIEITSTGQNPKSIEQAVSQVSYALADKVISAIEKQLKDPENESFIHHHVPVIVTTAKLYRMKKNISSNFIKKADSIEKIASRHNILLIEPTTSLELEKHTHNKFSEFESKFPRSYLEERINPIYIENKLNFDYIKREILSFPNGILVVSLSDNNRALKKILNVFHEIVNPSDDTKNIIRNAFGNIKSLNDFRQ